MSNNNNMMSKPPDHFGFLEKKGGKVVSRNQRRWFELRGTSLLYYETKPLSREERDEPTGCIDIRDTRCVDHQKVKEGQYAWVITGPRLTKNYTLIAETDEEKNAWMQKIEAAAGAAMSSPRKQPADAVGIPRSASPLSSASSGENNSRGEATNGNAANGGKKHVQINSPRWAEKSSSSNNNSISKKGRSSSLYGKAPVGVDDFEVVRVIGKGSFGKVMEVRYLKTGQTFAMKTMSKEKILQQNLLEHIFAEKSILQNIRHPFVVGLHYAFQTDEKLYLVLDFLSGGELFFHIRSARHFNESRAKFYAAQIGHALGHLHSLDIIYRDLKPENAVLDKDGNVCLTDFGLAKCEVTAANGASTFCGTPEYLAPEFLMGTGHGKAVDWWSLGILIYEMLCGIPPFYSENVNEMYEKIIRHPLAFDRRLKISPEAQDLCARLLDRNPQTRLTDVKQFMTHPWMQEVNFEALVSRKIPPPFVPDQDPIKNFDPEFTNLAPKLSVGEGAARQAATGDKFSNFTFNGL